MGELEVPLVLPSSPSPCPGESGAGMSVGDLFLLSVAARFPREPLTAWDWCLLGRRGESTRVVGSDSKGGQRSGDAAIWFTVLFGLVLFLNV